MISAEPGIYLPGKLGVRIEDVAVVRGGCLHITRAPSCGLSQRRPGALSQPETQFGKFAELGLFARFF